MRGIFAVTFDDVRKISLVWPEVEDGTSYGTPALKVRKKLLVRLKEDLMVRRRVSAVSNHEVRDGHPSRRAQESALLRMRPEIYSQRLWMRAFAASLRRLGGRLCCAVSDFE